MGPDLALVLYWSMCLSTHSPRNCYLTISIVKLMLHSLDRESDLLGWIKSGFSLGPQFTHQVRWWTSFGTNRKDSLKIGSVGSQPWLASQVQHSFLASSSVFLIVSERVPDRLWSKVVNQEFWTSMVFIILCPSLMKNATSVAQLCLTLCDPTDCSTPGFPVHHQLPELAQTHVHQISGAIQPSYPLSS